MVKDDKCLVHGGELKKLAWGTVVKYCSKKCRSKRHNKKQNGDGFIYNDELKCGLSAVDIPKKGQICEQFDLLNNSINCLTDELGKMESSIKMILPEPTSIGNENKDNGPYLVPLAYELSGMNKRIRNAIGTIRRITEENQL